MAASNSSEWLAYWLAISDRHFWAKAAHCAGVPTCSWSRRSARGQWPADDAARLEGRCANPIAAYAVEDGKIISVPNSGGVSPDLSEVEAVYASSWLKNILTEMST